MEELHPSINRGGVSFRIETGWLFAGGAKWATIPQWEPRSGDVVAGGRVSGAG
jgi:hypothetical protein